MRVFAQLPNIWKFQFMNKFFVKPRTNRQEVLLYNTWNVNRILQTYVVFLWNYFCRYLNIDRKIEKQHYKCKCVP